MKLYDIVYGLVACGGRESALFGSCAPTAYEAFSRSLAGETFPELWFEVPLAGRPWFDLHSLVSHGDVAGKRIAFSGQGGVYTDALAWFADQGQGTVRQLALSYDVHAGDVDKPAVQLLMNGRDTSVAFGFLEAAGRPDAKEAYRTFIGRMPKEWYACYIGTFPGRQTEGEPRWIRIECIVGATLQQVYADDISVLREHLARMGITYLGDDGMSAIRRFARSPFPLELQFDVGACGEALPTVSASVRFVPKDWTEPERRDRIGNLLQEVQSLGLADNRVKQLAGTAFAEHVTRGNESIRLFCFPAFVKLRWQEGERACAKAYLMAGARP